MYKKQYKYGLKLKIADIVRTQGVKNTDWN